MSEEEYDFRHELSNVPWVSEYSFIFEYLLNKQTCRLSFYQMLIYDLRANPNIWVRFDIDYFFLFLY